jgi:hypothetical protein
MPGRRSLITRNGIMSKPLDVIPLHTAPIMNHPAPLDLDLLVQWVNHAV